MRYLLILCILLLTGCGYDYSELNAAKAACSNAGGRFSTKEFSNGQIFGAYCSVDGVRYRIGRTTYSFMEGVKE